MSAKLLFILVALVCAATLAGALSLRDRLPRLEVIEDTGLFGALKPQLRQQSQQQSQQRDDASPAAPAPVEAMHGPTEAEMEDDFMSVDPAVSTRSTSASDAFRFAAEAVARARADAALVAKLQSSMKAAQMAAASESSESSASADPTLTDSESTGPTRRRKTIPEQISQLLSSVRDQIATRQRLENERFPPKIEFCEKKAKELKDRLQERLNIISTHNDTLAKMQGDLAQANADLTKLREKMEVDHMRMQFLAKSINDIADDREQAHQLFENKKRQIWKTLEGVAQLREVLTKQEYFNSTMLDQTLKMKPLNSQPGGASSGASTASEASGAAAKTSFLEVDARAPEDSEESTGPDPTMYVARDVANTYRMLSLLIINLESYIETLKENEKREQVDFNNVYSKLNATAYKRVKEHHQDRRREKDLVSRILGLEDSIAQKEVEVTPVRDEAAAIGDEYTAQYSLCLNLRMDFNAQTDRRQSTILAVTGIEDNLKPMLDALAANTYSSMEGTLDDDQSKLGATVKARPGSVDDNDPEFARRVAAAAEERKKQAEKTAQMVRAAVDKAVQTAQLLAPKPTNTTVENDPRSVIFG